MLPPVIGEHKADIGLAACGAGAGAYIGKKLYKNVPTKMVRYVQEGTKVKEVITDDFINYAKKVSEQDLFSRIDPHTERSYLTHKLETIKKNASRAKTNPKGPERWQFQKIYDLGVQFMTNRGGISKDDIGLAKRGANAIYYGRKIEKSGVIAKCAIIGGLIGIGIKNGISKFRDYKEKTQIN